jgi:hypothetical protein
LMLPFRMKSCKDLRFTRLGQPPKIIPWKQLSGYPGKCPVQNRSVQETVNWGETPRISCNLRHCSSDHSLPPQVHITANIFLTTYHSIALSIKPRIS